MGPDVRSCMVRATRKVRGIVLEEGPEAASEGRGKGEKRCLLEQPSGLFMGTMTCAFLFRSLILVTSLVGLRSVKPA